MENSIKNRIQKLMELEQLNPASFAKAIQVNPSAISHILNDRNKPSTDIIIKILNTYRLVNADWLILGIGSMYRNEISKPAVSSQTTSLFDTVLDAPVSVVQSDSPAVYVSSSKGMQEIPANEVLIEPEKNSASIKMLKKIIVYYSDNSFEEFLSTTT